MKILFVIQGEGRGHMTQAIALAQILRSAGHEIVGACVGGAGPEDFPGFLEKRLQTRVFSHVSPVIKLSEDSRSIDVWETMWSTTHLVRAYLFSVQSIERAITSLRPDLIVNFYEPLMGVVAIRNQNSPPVVAIGHQFMFYHPKYPFTSGTALQRRGLMWFTRLAAAGAERLLALSLYPAPDLSRHRLKVVPPLIRSQLFEVTPIVAPDPFLLVYIWRPEMLEEVKDWIRRGDGFRVYCFLKLPGPAKRIPVSDRLTLFDLDDTLFLLKLSRCSGLATTAGFETMVEAALLGKPLLMVPTHLEQQCNAQDASRTGIGRVSSTFDLALLQGQTPLDRDVLLDWVARAAPLFLRELESAAGHINGGSAGPGVRRAPHRTAPRALPV